VWQNPTFGGLLSKPRFSSLPVWAGRWSRPVSGRMAVFSSHRRRREPPLSQEDALPTICLKCESNKIEKINLGQKVGATVGMFAGGLGCKWHDRSATLAAELAEGR
jgi:hypothetical protein